MKTRLLGLLLVVGLLMVVSVNWWKSRKRVIIGRGDRAYAACFIPSMS